MAIVLFGLTSQFVRADNSYGFNMDEAVHILQQEKLRQQYNRRYQREHAGVARKQSSRRAPPQAKTVVRRATHQPAPKSAARYIPPTRRPAGSVPGAEALFQAATNGDVSTIGRLLSEGVNINAGNRERETALHMAAARGGYSAVIYLVNHGANINARTVKNWLPLHHAVRFGHANIANYLLKRGSSPYVRTSDGMNAIDMAKGRGDQRMLNILGVR